MNVEQVMWADTASVQRAARAADVIISTLPAGVADPFAQAVAPREGQVLLDVVYSPRRTALRSAFERAGGVIAEGTDMLVYQGAAQVQLMTGHSPDPSVMRHALEEELERRACQGPGGQRP